MLIIMTSLTIMMIKMMMMMMMMTIYQLDVYKHFLGWIRYRDKNTISVSNVGQWLTISYPIWPSRWWKYFPLTGGRTKSVH